MNIVDARHRSSSRKPVAVLKSVVKVGTRLYGTVFNHRGFKVGEQITTSPVLGQWVESGVTFAETENTVYVLLGGCR